jgi:hypothetical protein
MKKMVAVACAAIVMSACTKEKPEKPEKNPEEIMVVVYAKGSDSSIIATTPIVKLKLK